MPSTYGGLIQSSSPPLSPHYLHGGEAEHDTRTPIALQLRQTFFAWLACLSRVIQSSDRHVCSRLLALDSGLIAFKSPFDVYCVCSCGDVFSHA